MNDAWESMQDLARRETRMRIAQRAQTAKMTKGGSLPHAVRQINCRRHELVWRYPRCMSAKAPSSAATALLEIAMAIVKEIPAPAIKTAAALSL
jgi:hypothetical protein